MARLDFPLDRGAITWQYSPARSLVRIGVEIGPHQGENRSRDQEHGVLKKELNGTGFVCRVRHKA